MRIAGFRVGADDGTECTFSVFPGDVGGLRANLDRWRGQMGLDPLLGPVPEMPKIPFLGRPAPLVELRGGYRGMGADVREADATLLGVIQLLPTQTAFVKLVGPSARVEAERARFEAFVGSIRELAPAPPAAPLAWTAPEGWRQAPPQSMRVVTYRPRGAPGAECYVTILRGTAGGVAENVNRWREQMGQPALNQEAITALPTIEVLGRPAPLVEVVGDFTGMDGARAEGSGLLGVVRMREQDTLFVKMTGPADTIRAERARFEAFCRSLREPR